MALEQEQDDSGAIPEWVVTFGDMMSLLLTFFIMLVSLSEIKQEEHFQAMVESIRRKFGHDSVRVNLIPGHIRPRNSSLSKMATMGRAKRFDMMDGGDKVEAPVGDHPRVRVIRPGARTAVGTVLTFDEWSVVLADGHKRDLRALSGTVGGKPQKIEIRGHASSRPLPPGEGRFADHWDLAYRRAKAVADFLRAEVDIDPRRLRISVAGQYEPFTTEPDPEEQRLNPRVEIFLLDEVTQEVVAEPGGSGELPPAAANP